MKSGGTLCVLRFGRDEVRQSEVGEGEPIGW
jgi:hypothetical protein